MKTTLLLLPLLLVAAASAAEADATADPSAILARSDHARGGGLPGIV
jgi:hypothetical protein